MNYEQKYKDALERAKVLYAKGTLDLEEIFSELRESEDEKMRKEIISLVKYTKGRRIGYDPRIPQDDMIAWLEKQKVLSTEEELQVREDVLWCIKQASKYAKDENEMGTCWFAEKWLEKQGKKHFENYDEVEEEKVDFVSNGFIKCNTNFLDFKEGETYWLEYIGDDNYNVRSDNLLGKTYHITPYQLYTNFNKKFNIGDYVVLKYRPNFYGGSNYVKIINIESGKYYFNNGTWEYPEEIRHWTIKDAKDGDILATSNYIYIFNSIDKETETVSFYCLMEKSNEHFSFGDYKIHDEILNSIPATQEQRDLLFQKIEEVGYKWDADKLELIELKEIEEPENYKNQVISKMVDLVKDYIKQNQKPVEWDEDDTYMLEQAIKCVNNSGKLEVSTEEIEDWLKFRLPQITQTTEQWKPSDLQIEALESATENCAYSEYQDCLRELIKQLKKL